MSSKRVHAVSAKLFMGVLALSWLVQIDAIHWPKSLGSSSSQSEALEGRSTSWNSSLSYQTNLPASKYYFLDNSRVAGYVADGLSKHSWAYAAVGALEGQQKRLGLLGPYGLVIPLSAQMLISCWDEATDTTTRWPFWYVETHGLAPQSILNPCCDCALDQRLMKNKSAFKKFAYRNHPEFPNDTDVLLRLFVQTGPLMVGLDKVNIERSNGEKTFDCVTSKQANHFVLLVGYDKNYLIFKNSQGTNWGSGGYGFIRRTKGCMPFAFVAY